MTGDSDKMTELTLAQGLALLRNRNLSLLESYEFALGAAKIAQSNDEVLARIQVVTQDLIEIIQAESAKSKELGLESEYHNQQHIADAVLCMGYLLGQSPHLDAHQKHLLLLVMLVHDFGHRGIANKLSDLSHEDESIQLLKATPLHALPAKDIHFVEECILGTKPENVSKVSKAFASNPRDSFVFMRALVNDADIAASFIDPFGGELSRLILLEKGIAQPTQKETDEVLSAFRRHARINTPVARRLLGLPVED